MGLEAGMELVFKKSNLQTAEQLGNHWLSVKSVYLLLSGHREPQKLLKTEKWQRAAGLTWLLKERWRNLVLLIQDQHLDQEHNPELFVQILL